SLKPASAASVSAPSRQTASTCSQPSLRSAFSPPHRQVLPDLRRQGKQVSPMPIDVSFEFFPPADADMEATLWKSVERLAPLSPRFVSVTYGADGSTRERTHKVITRIQRETQLTGAPHLTCVDAPRGEVLDIARRY